MWTLTYKQDLYIWIIYVVIGRRTKSISSYIVKSYYALYSMTAKHIYYTVTNFVHVEKFDLLEKHDDALLENMHDTEEWKGRRRIHILCV